MPLIEETLKLNTMLVFAVQYFLLHFLKVPDMLGSGAKKDENAALDWWLKPPAVHLLQNTCSYYRNFYQHLGQNHGLSTNKKSWIKLFFSSKVFSILFVSVLTQLLPECCVLDGWCECKPCKHYSHTLRMAIHCYLVCLPISTNSHEL